MTEPVIPVSRRERKKQATRLKILNAALTLFAERGYDQVRVEDIRDQADIANATFFSYFPTKASLLKAFGEFLIERIKTRLEEFDAGAIESLEILRVIYFDEWADHLDLWSKVMTSGDSPERVALSSTAEEMHQLVSDILTKGQETGEVSSDHDPGLVAHCLLGGWRAVMVELMETKDRSRAVKRNREILDIVLDGVAD